MKKIWNVFIAVALVGGIAGCESICSKYCADIDTDEMAEDGAVESNFESDLLDGTSDFNSEQTELSAAVFGALSTGMEEDGANICVEYDGLAVYFQILKVKGGVLTATNAIKFEKDLGFEISLVDNGSGLEVAVVTAKEPFARNSNLKGENIKTLTLGGSDPKKFDIKISKACPAIGSGGVNPPALIGGNDARDGNIATSSALIGDLSNNRKMRIHVDEYDGGADVIVSTDSIELKKYGSLKFSRMGVPSWGCDFKKEHK